MKRRILEAVLCMVIGCAFLVCGTLYSQAAVVNAGEGLDTSESVAELAEGEYPGVAFNNAESHARVTWVTTTCGYRSTDGITIYFPFTERCTEAVSYEVYRSTKASGGYTKIRSGCYEGGAGAVSITDSTAVLGVTYYYKVKAAVGSSMESASSFAVSGVKGCRYTGGDVSFELSRGAKGVDISISGWGANNRFDIYRSGSLSGGFKKIKTIHGHSYTDTNVKKGSIYYYKIVPVYYDYVYGKTVAGPASKVKGVRFLMGKTDSYRIVRTSDTSVRLSWGKIPGANTYEIWYRRADVSGDRYIKAGKTGSTSFAVKGLKTGVSYMFKVKNQMVSGGKIICEDSQTLYIYMGYSGIVEDITATPAGIVVSADKKTVALYTNLKWSRVWGASGYKIMAHNMKTKAYVNVATIKSSDKTTYRFKNPGSKTNGMKYDYVCIVPYRGKALGRYGDGEDVNLINPIRPAKVTRRSDYEARVTWKSITGAVAYDVYRRNEQAETTMWLGSTDKTVFDDEYVTTKTRYTYFVVPDMGVDGIEVIYTFDFPKKGASYVHVIGTPKISSAANTAAGTATLKWNYVGLAKYYIVYRSTGRNGKYTKIGTTVKPVFEDKKAVKGKTYYYKVQTYTVSRGGVASKSAYSGTVSVKSVK